MLVNSSDQVRAGLFTSFPPFSLRKPGKNLFTCSRLHVKLQFRTSKVILIRLSLIEFLKIYGETGKEPRAGRPSGLDQVT